ncbi:hypothetical protein SELMODRAFT_427700 [Selaginella moellendorffii]|uniref:Uncharacterized protein n=1 Tax=Selaginella moellendorffii TaxID=88036 RepID=D8T0F7_SELML|nr:hypothetical protein SELMODRAFT_427700 [Selaginella moellendorffii]
METCIQCDTPKILIISLRSWLTSGLRLKGIDRGAPEQERGWAGLINGRVSLETPLRSPRDPGLLDVEPVKASARSLYLLAIGLLIREMATKQRDLYVIACLPPAASYMLLCTTLFGPHYFSLVQMQASPLPLYKWRVIPSIPVHQSPLQACFSTDSKNQHIEMVSLLVGQ